MSAYGLAVRGRRQGGPGRRRLVADAKDLVCVVYFVVITIGELYLSPIGLSLVSKIAPARMISTTMGLWLGTSFIGNFVAGWLGSFWSSMDKMSFFIMLAVVATSAGGVIWSFFNRPLKSILQG